MRSNFMRWTAAGSLVLAVGLLLHAAAKRILILNGVEVPGQVMEMNGRTYIEIEALARAANGSVHYQSDRILLSLPSEPAPPNRHLERLRPFRSRSFGADA